MERNALDFLRYLVLRADSLIPRAGSRNNVRCASSGPAGEYHAAGGRGRFDWGRSRLIVD